MSMPYLLTKCVIKWYNIIMNNNNKESLVVTVIKVMAAAKIAEMAIESSKQRAESQKLEIRKALLEKDPPKVKITVIHRVAAALFTIVFCIFSGYLIHINAFFGLIPMLFITAVAFSIIFVSNEKYFEEQKEIRRSRKSYLKLTMYWNVNSISKENKLEFDKAEKKLIEDLFEVDALEEIEKFERRTGKYWDDK